MTNSNARLDNIASRQRSTRARDFMFAALLALAGVIGATGVGAAATASSSNVATSHVFTSNG